MMIMTKRTVTVRIKPSTDEQRPLGRSVDSSFTGGVEGDTTPMEKRHTPLWLLPNLLSLDAPLVAVAWMWMLSQALRVEYVHPAAWWVLAASIWTIYVLDRLLDGWLSPETRKGSPRHIFHWRWRWPLLVMALLVGLSCLQQALYVLPRSMFSAGLVAVLMCVVYFVTAMFQGPDVPYVKNMLAGMIFAMGVGIPVNAANASLLVTDFNDVLYAFAHTGLVDAIWNFGLMVLRTLAVIFHQCRDMLIFALLCMMNITAIDLWERAEAATDEETAYAHEATLTLGLIILAGGSLVFAVMYADEYSKPFYYAVMVAAAVLQGVNHYRERFSPNAQRVLADVALLVPLPVFLVV
jgi:hypothetical protein